MERKLAAINHSLSGIWHFLSRAGGSSQPCSRAHGGSCGESEEATPQKCSRPGGGQEDDPAAELWQELHRCQSVFRSLIPPPVLLRLGMMSSSTCGWLLDCAFVDLEDSDSRMRSFQQVSPHSVSSDTTPFSSPQSVFCELLSCVY